MVIKNLEKVKKMYSTIYVEREDARVPEMAANLSSQITHKSRRDLNEK